MTEIEELARDLVALWQSPNIQSLSRAGRNAAIEDTRNRLIQACSSTAEPSPHKATDAGSNPAAPTNVPVAKQVNAEGLNPLHLAGSNPARDTNSFLTRSSVGSEHGISNPAVEGSNPSASTTTADQFNFDVFERATEIMAVWIARFRDESETPTENDSLTAGHLAGALAANDLLVRRLPAIASQDGAGDK